MTRAMPVRRPLFVATVLTGSFLLFVVQPMVARMALPQLGGAPNVWNSAMLVYQALLLGGYAYAQLLSRLPVARQATIHLALLAVAAVTLPIHLAALAPPAPGREALWVPVLFALSIGPVFFLVSAQAPLMQRWFSAHPQAGEPWALYAASNLGSFAGLIAYPLVFEPLLGVHVQAWAWSAGYAALVVLIGLCGWARWGLHAQAREAEPDDVAPIPARRIVRWLVLAAVPSGLMLSTTTHLTTDVFAMPLLWVIPLGLYLLSFVPAFADRRPLANSVSRVTPLLILLAGGFAMTARGTGSLSLALAGVVLLFAVAVSLHARLYDLRPPASRLTLFYLVMSAGGALGGLFTALFAPLWFDWVWEHPLLVFAAALLVPMRPLLGWMQMEGLTRPMILATTTLLVVFAGFLGWLLWGLDPQASPLVALLLTLAIAFCGVLALGDRGAYLTILAILMFAHGGWETLQQSLSGARSRSYFGVYTVRDYPSEHQRVLAHGTTMHGMQFTDFRRRVPTTYYGRSSGIGIAMSRVPALYGSDARVGVIGLGTGTLACWRVPGQRWTFFEIDRAVLDLSRQRRFTYLADCAPDAIVRIGDARLEVARLPAHSFDVIAVDAFSSDAIPLHLLTAEALQVYQRALGENGLLMIHISNRYFELEPQLSAALGEQGWSASVLSDDPKLASVFTASVWVAVTRDPAQLARITAGRKEWKPLLEVPGTSPWTDEHASILGAVRWRNLVGKVL
jgi:SAM-dependent methyltransferase